MTMASCPKCDNYIKINFSVHEGQIITCSRCRTTLEVVDTDPVELDIHINNPKKFRKKKRSNQKDNWYFDEADDYSDRKHQKSDKRKRSLYRN